MNERAQQLLAIADDELVLGWRNSEWTGIAPFLEEDVAFSSIAQNEIGHARALYELVARELGTTADELAFDRAPDEFRCAQLVEVRLAGDWAKTIARHYMYEAADRIRIERLKTSPDEEVAGLAAKIDREETYHRLHAEMWLNRLKGSPEGRQRLDEAITELWPYALGLLDDEEARRAWIDHMAEHWGDLGGEAVPRGEHTDELRELWEEMTMVRRSVPGATW